jgi:hypothetical protein
MQRPSDQQLAAFKRLATLQEGQHLIEWLEANLKLCSNNLESVDEEFDFRRLQGASKTLRSVIRAVKDAKESIHKREVKNEQQTGKRSWS